MILEELIEKLNNCFGTEPVIEIEMSRKLAPDGKTPHRGIELSAYSLDENLRKIRFEGSVRGSDPFVSLLYQSIQKISTDIEEQLGNKFARLNSFEREYLAETLESLKKNTK